MAQQRPERIAGEAVPHRGFRSLGLRLRSAALFAPPVFAAIYFGTPWFDLLIIATGFVMAWEWARMCSGGKFTLVGWAMEAGIAACLLALYVNQLILSLAIAAVVAGVVGVFARARGHESPARIALGAMLVSVFCIAFLWLRALPGDGLGLVVWLVLAVWFTDAGGYFFGRSIGGPKLAPRISPNKTWAGLGGGVLLAVVWSCVWLVWLGGRDLMPAIGAGLAIAILAQIGDLTVSAVKRRFGVKDTGALIPGHGGVLDRLDGMLLTGPAAAIVLVLSGKGWI